MPVDSGLSWQALLDALRTDFPHLYRSWFENLPAPTLEGGEVHVVVEDAARLRFLQDSCSQAFTQAAIALTQRLVSVRFTSPGHAADVVSTPTVAAPLSCTPLSADYTFDEFVVGASNRLAHAACQAVCARPGSLYNPLFIHGASGLGKTHLLQATCAQLLTRHPAGSACYIPCESFINDFVRAIETGQLPRFRDRARRAGALVIDDVQFLANRESSQEELFHTFNALYHTGKQIILSADCAPTELPSLEERLVSRFNWGLVTQIGPPNREMRQAILYKKARLRGYELPPEVLDFIAAHVKANIRLLEGALTRVMSETQIAGKPMGIETTREVLAQLSGEPARSVQVSDILKAVSQHFGVRAPELLGRKRSRSISQPRQVAMYLARKLTPLSLEEVGAHFGGRDHSTVLHAERTIDSARLKNTTIADALTQLTSQLSAHR